MSYSRAFEERQIIPRWHLYPVARWLGLTQPNSISNRSISASHEHLDRINSWKKSGRILHAAEVVGSALALNLVEDSSARDAAEFILSSANESTNSMRSVAETFLSISTGSGLARPTLGELDNCEYYRSAIASTRAATRRYPQNPIAWMDLAYLYSVIGKITQARKCVRIAMGLNADNRHILRSAARFFLHVGEPDVALTYLRKGSSSSQDPWVIAAEIAVSDLVGMQPKKLRQAKKMIDDRNFSYNQISELAAAYGTIEFKHGADKQGKKLFKLALNTPTENTVAQAVFFQDYIGRDEQVLKLQEIENSYEVRCNVSMGKGAFGPAFEAAKKWFKYQPFSSRPAIQGSYVASVYLHDDEQAAQLAKAGLVASPDSFLLRNNLVFALASAGKLASAKTELSQINSAGLHDEDRHILDATRGCLYFREGSLELGRTLYRSAIDYFKKHNNPRLAAAATCFLAREELRVSSTDTTELLSEAAELAKKQGLELLLKHILQS